MEDEEGADQRRSCQKNMVCMLGPAWRDSICAKSGIDVSKCPQMGGGTKASKEKKPKHYQLGMFTLPEQEKK
jgi:hypothetical protein